MTNTFEVQPFDNNCPEGENHSSNFGAAEAVSIKDTSAASLENALALQSLLQQLLKNKELILLDKMPSNNNNKNNNNNKPVNPGPLGLLGFGMTTVLLNFHNAGAFPLGTIIPAMGLSMGGALQLIAGLLEFFNGNSFGATAFMCYGVFWISLCGIWLLPQEDHIHLRVSSKTFLGTYLLLWGIFTFVMTIVTFINSHLMMRMLFSTLFVLFILLSVGNFSENETILKIAGYEGIVCGAIALYIAFAEILADNLGKTILPLFPMKKKN